MTINYNVTGAKRKRLAQALGEFVHSEPVYQNAPSYAYAVGSYTIDKDGVITAPEDAPETADAVIAALSEHGFKPTLADKPVEERPTKAPKAKSPKKGRKAADIAPEPKADNHPEDAPAGPTEAPETPDVADGPEPGDQPEAPDKGEDSKLIMTPVGDNRLTVSIPRKSISDLALQRLMVLIENKEPLFKRALKADELPVVVEDDTVSFPWFTLRGENGEAAAYGQFIEALCRMAKEQTRILVKPYDSDNDRFSMRIFMVRMGMKGPQYALIRKLMMGDLTGNSGWRFGGPPKKGLEDTPDTTDAPADEAEEAAEPETEPPTADTTEADAPEPEATKAPADEAGMPPDDIQAITIIRPTGRKKRRKAARKAPEPPEAQPEDLPQTADTAEADTTEVDAPEPDIPADDAAADTPPESTDSEEAGPTAESEVQDEQLSER